MAKKQQKSRKVSQARRRQAPAARPTSTEAAPAPAPAPVSQPQASVRAARTEMLRAQAKENLQHEYRYVLADLRRLGIIAAVMFVVLVALALAFPLLGF